MHASQPLVRGAVYAAAIVLTTSVSPGLADELGELFTEWSNGQYTTVVDKLRAYRKKPYGKTAQVDYMIATSLCRMADSSSKGRNYYRSLLLNYQLSDPVRRKVRSEMEDCPASNPRPEMIAFGFHGSAEAGYRAGYAGKMYYVDIDEMAVAENVEVVRPIDATEYRRRLFSRAEWAKAVEATRARVARLGGQADTATSALQDRYQVQAADQFVLVCPESLTDQEIHRISAQLNEYKAYYLDFYDMRDPAFVLTAYVVRKSRDLRAIGREVHGIRVPNETIGYSFRNDLSVVAYLPSSLFLGTLAHELFHMLVRNDYGDIPAWLDEGTAALYETSEIDRGEVRLLGNWRRRILQASQKGDWQEINKPTVSQLVSMNWAEFNVETVPDGMPQDMGKRQQALNHATARALALFLYRQNQLSSVLDAFRNQDIGELPDTPERHAPRLIASTLEMPIDELEDRFQEWLRAYTNTP